MAEKILGRQEEKKLLRAALQSKEAELLVIYGRRRIGKTFLIRNFYAQQLVFEFTGAFEAGLQDQLGYFAKALQDAMVTDIPPAVPANWPQAFEYLTAFLKTVPERRPAVLLFDEFPWIHTPRSGFLSSFEHWWNSWASRQPHLKVVLCGSAASWMIQHIINSKGGLHNRITRAPIRLLPFTLGETKQYLESRGIRIKSYQLLQLYMALGGVPHYLKQVQKGEGVHQTIDRLFFAPHAMLKTEFSNLYQSLFKDASQHEGIVRALASRPEGLNRSEILKACGLTDGGGTTRLLDELEQSGFISHYLPFEKTTRDTIYKLTDEYSLFYLRFAERTRATGAGTWEKMAGTSSVVSWGGLAFESICQKHRQKIIQALGIKALTVAAPWRYRSGTNDAGAQIDLLLDRNDGYIHLCEIKFAKGLFTIDKSYATELQAKEAIFQAQTKTKKNIFLTFISTNGVKKNRYYDQLVQNEVTMEDLF